MPLRPLCLLLLLVAAAPAARAQQDRPEPPRPANWDPEREAHRARQLVERAGGPAAVAAAQDLFMSRVLRHADLGPVGSHDDFLRGVLADPARPNESRRAVLEAVGAMGRFRPAAACVLAREALDDPVLANQALTTFAMIEDAATYDFIARALAELRRRHRQGEETAASREALALVDVLERLGDPVLAARVLVGVFEDAEAPASRPLELRVLEALQRMTAQPFDDPQEWQAWFQREGQRLTLTEWNAMVARVRAERLKRHEEAVERYYGRMLQQLQADPTALLAEIEAALAPDALAVVRKRALRELGTLAQGGNQRAREVLRARLGAPTSNADKALVIEALSRVTGASGEPLLSIEDLLPYVRADVFRPLRLAAIAALGRLRTAAAVAPLMNLLPRESAQVRDGELALAVIEALGECQRNPGGDVSRRLRGLAEGLLVQNGAAPPSANQLLIAIGTGLGKLPYGEGATAEVPEVAALLGRLAAHADVNVRFHGVTGLGKIPGDPNPQGDAFQLLARRLQVEPAVPVRKAILDGVWQHGMQKDRPERGLDAIELLAPFVDDPDEALRSKSRQRLPDLLARPEFAANFAGYRKLLDTLRAAGKPDGAGGTFLSGLPTPDGLSEEQKAHKETYLLLLEARASWRLPSAPAGALDDVEAVLVGRALDPDEPQAGAPPEVRRLYLFKARALLAVTPARPLEAYNIAAACLPGPGVPVPIEVWDVLLDALTALRQGGDPAAIKEPIERLTPLAAGAPQQIQQRLAELRQGPRPPQPPQPPGGGGGGS